MSQPPGFEKLATNGTTLFTSSKADSSLFLYKHAGVTTLLIVYVDDILITGGSPAFIDFVVSQLHAKFSLKDLGELKLFFGIEVHRAGMHEANTASTPIAAYPKLSKAEGNLFSDPTLYRSVIGALQYICHTRPDINFSVNKAAQYMQQPRDTHWTAVKRILRYLRGTLDYGLWFTVDKSMNLTMYSDADWGSDADDRRSTSGYCLFLGANIISWSSKKQRAVSRSTAEAEYRSLADAASELMWVQAILADLDVHTANVSKIWCENMITKQ
ncbi:uncharacterized mitochondrial protein AtMg00810-like [Gossypium hirsutum]|uniref:Uncharacterized mitochondrial protein AtMg00810-like n=1 Tax=Gossypium hirsutum TaxID=3635 RepID=A0ABM3AJY4_GOSHI|nr:uncharacterized mitochondrial protein AtMg00810-like [Gossypium hirsutum]